MRTQNDSEGESETSRPLGPELPAPSPCQEIIESGTGEIVREADSIVMLMCLFSPAVLAGRPITRPLTGCATSAVRWRPRPRFASRGCVRSWSLVRVTGSESEVPTSAFPTSSISQRFVEKKCSVSKFKFAIDSGFAVAMMPSFFF